MFVEEQTILSGGVEELTKLREELINQASIRSEIEHLIVESGKLEKQIEAEEKLIKNTIEATVNKRRNEVTKSFDSEIQKEKNKLNDIKSKKNKVKKKGVRDRIDKETLSLKEANRTLHSEIRTALGHSGVPTYCDSSYTLYAVRNEGNTYFDGAFLWSGDCFSVDYDCIGRQTLAVGYAISIIV